MNTVNLLSLKGKRALICGASQGIGEACARLFAEAGAQVILISRRPEELERIRKELPGEGHLSFQVDLAEPKDIEKVMPQVPAIDILVHNSGGPKAGPLIEASVPEILQALHQHVGSAQRLAQFFAPEMKKKKFGRIINIISTSVKVPLNNLGVSNTVRGAMASWAKTQANELAPFGITVNNVLPGYTRTPRFESLRKTTAQSRGVSEAQVEADWLASVPARRFGESQEIALAALFLASDAAAYINGINLPVDGGRTPSL